MPAAAPYDIVVVGAGVGGLTCALACACRGLRAVVLERDPTRDFRRQGYNLFLPSAELDTFRDACGVDPKEVRVEYVCDVDPHGEMPLLAPRGRPDRPGVVRRRELRDKMLDACAARGVEVRFAAEVAGVDDGGGDTCAVRLRGGGAVEGRCVAGCDGIGSRVRRSVAADAALQWSGAVCLRGAAPDAAGSPLRALAGLPPGSAAPMLMFVSVGPGVGLNMTLFGGRVTWVCEFRPGAPVALARPDLPRLRAEALSRIEGWHPTLRGMVAGTEEAALHAEALSDLGDYDGPIGSGRVTLVGDAAHPLVLTGGGGAAARDAAALASALAPPLPAAAVPARLREYEQAARRRTPLSLVEETRSRLPSTADARRAAAHAKKERGRPARWRRQRERGTATPKL